MNNEIKVIINTIRNCTELQTLGANRDELNIRKIKKLVAKLTTLPKNEAHAFVKGVDASPNVDSIHPEE